MPHSTTTQHHHHVLLPLPLLLLLLITISSFTTASSISISIQPRHTCVLDPVTVTVPCDAIPNLNTTVTTALLSEVSEVNTDKGTVLSLPHMDLPPTEDDIARYTRSLSSFPGSDCPLLPFYRLATATTAGTIPPRPSHTCAFRASFRAPVAGRFSVTVCTPSDVLSSSTPRADGVCVPLCQPMTVDVSVCDDSFVLDVEASDGVDATRFRPPPTPSLHLRGVLPVGSRGMKTHPSLLPPQARADGLEVPTSGTGWSLSMWLWLWQDATGSFRTLFYKGPGHQQRTPSAWFLPHSRRLALRASSVSNPDLGAESRFDLPVRQWVHLAFTFENATADGSPGPGPGAPNGTSFAFRMFVNGVQDSALFYNEPILPNDGPVHLGRDPWMEGARMLLADVKVFPAALNESDVIGDYKATHLLYTTDSSNPAHAAAALGKDAVGGDADRAGLLDGLTRATRIVSSWGDLPFRHAATAEQVSTREQAQTMLESCDSDYVAAMELLDIASDDGRGDAVASRLLATYLLQPGRPDCPEGLSMAATLVDQNSEYVRSPGRARRLFYAAAQRGDVHALGTWAQLVGTNVGVDPSTASDSLLLPDSAASGGGGGGEGSTDSDSNSGSNRGGAPSDDDVELALGMLHVAAMAGFHEAWYVLGLRYLDGEGGLPVDVEVGGWLISLAAESSRDNFHAHGNQPHHEMHRLSADTVETIEVTERGEDDERIQYQLNQAEKGHIPSMMAMGSLYYFGSHGLARDHGEAFKWFRRAADTGHVGGQAEVATMLLKGEGVEQNHTAAVEWYKLAAAQDSIRALNGLGFAYFYGNGVDQNYTEAFTHFSRAASFRQDADSLFNTGMCYVQGHGVNRSMEAARELFEVSVSMFGHFDSAMQLGMMYLDGDGVPRNVFQAVRYLRATAGIGAWGGHVRKGFNRYLARDYDGAALWYLHSWWLGYEVGAANAGYLLDKGLSTGVVGRDGSAAMARHLYAYSLGRGAVDVALPLGDYYFYGLGGVGPDVATAAALYSKSADAGNPQAAYNLGYLNEYGAGSLPRNEQKAIRYYKRVLDLAPPGGGAVVPVQLALWRIAARGWAKSKGLWPLWRPQRMDGSSVAVNESYVDAARTLSGSFVSMWMQWALDDHKAADREGEPTSGGGEATSGVVHVLGMDVDVEWAAVAVLCVALVFVLTVRCCRRRCAKSERQE